MTPNVASAALNFLMNDPALFDAVRAITGCARIGSFAGRVFRVADQDGSSLGWHDDAVRDRLVALSLNAGTERYRGGMLEIRDRAAHCVIARVKNRDFGDAVLFRIGPALEHRNSPVTGGTAKTAFAGWFMKRSGSATSPRWDLRTTIARHTAARERQPALAEHPIHAELRTTIPSSIAWRQIGDETVVIDLESGTCYRLDEIGGRIWKMLSSGVGAAAIARAIAKDYAVAAERIRHDINLLIDDLARRRLIAPPGRTLSRPASAACSTSS